MFIFKSIIKPCLILVVLSLFSLKGFSQTDAGKAETDRLMKLLSKFEGTYQVQIIDSRELAAIPLSLMDTIEVKRDANSVKYVWLKSNVRVKILPTTEITAPNFKSLERVIYISSSELN